MIKTRYAPSPTGFLHIGGLRTALYCYLIAKQNGGKFLLRVEDTDQKRSVEGAVENMINSLHWAGLNIDEGVDLDKEGKIVQTGDKGPYIQSQRLEIYKKHADELLERGEAYHCFCTAERLAEMKDYQQKNKLPTGYDGHCRDLDVEEVKKKLVAGEPSVIRMKMPKEGETTFTDLIRGEVTFKNELIDDQVLIKTDGFPTYHLAVVIDDHFMEITHVIRGEEWLSSTPKHLQLYKYFGWTPPLFAHLSLLLNADKSKLSKRQGDVAVEDYIKKGYLPEAMINFVAFLGWNPGTEQELFTLEELVKEFKIEKINKSGAVFNLDKLNWYNQQYTKKWSNEDLAGWAGVHLMELLFSKENIPVPTMPKELTDENMEAMGKPFLMIRDKYAPLLIKAVALERERISTMSELVEAIKFIIKLPDYDGSLLVWKKSSAEEVKKILPELAEFLNTNFVQEWNKENLEAEVKKWIGEKGYQNGSVLWPLRVALSGQDKSPGPFEIAEVLGKEETISRINLAIGKI